MTGPPTFEGAIPRRSYCRPFRRPARPYNQDMEMRPLGAANMEPSVIGLGTWRTFDVPPDDEAGVQIRRQVVDAALAAGSTFFDSSPMYGDAEEVLALALGDRRSEVLVATKVWSRDVAEGRRQIERALRWYGGLVDLYQIHNLVEWRAYLPILRSLQEAGDIRAIGITHYQHSAFPEMMRIMETEEIAAIQIPYNAADTAAGREILPLAREIGLGVITMSPLGSGDLVRAAPAAGELAPLRDYGIETWPQALLKWVVSDSRITCTIPATSRPDRARSNAAAGDPPFLPEEERERVAWLARRLTR